MKKILISLIGILLVGTPVFAQANPLGNLGNIVNINPNSITKIINGTTQIDQTTVLGLVTILLGFVNIILALFWAFERKMEDMRR